VTDGHVHSAWSSLVVKAQSKTTLILINWKFKKPNQTEHLLSLLDLRIISSNHFMVNPDISIKNGLYLLYNGKLRKVNQDSGLSDFTCSFPTRGHDII